jgi:hypothetical protein
MQFKQKVLAIRGHQSGTGGLATHQEIAMSNQAKSDQIISQIAQKHLGIETLRVRHSDRLDFHDCGVASIEAALKAAFEAGQKAAGSLK